MTSETEICSNALREIGDDPITSLVEDSERARLCNAFYAPTRDMVLRAYPWNFAIARQQLSRVSTSPAFGFSYQYQLPTSPYCLRVLSLYEDLPWKVEGRKLLTDSSTAKIVYISRVSDPAQFDQMFADALTARLAARLAYPVTGSAQVARDLYTIYMDRLRDARSMDAQEGTPEEFDSDTLIEVR